MSSFKFIIVNYNKYKGIVMFDIVELRLQEKKATTVPRPGVSNVLLAHAVKPPKSRHQQNSAYRYCL